MARSGTWILLVSLAAPAAAQDTDHFGQLIGVLGPGDRIRVALSGEGLVRPAQVVGLKFETLTVRIQGRQLDLGRGDVLSVRYGLDDSVLDGFWRGFAISGAGCAVSSYALCTRADLCPAHWGGYLLGAGLFATLGGWIGVGVDRLTQTEVRWPATTQAAWSVAPLLAPDRRGLAVSPSF